MAVFALMSEILDYAGLYPPASLDMATTVRNYAGIKSSPDRWMLGRLVIPVNRFAEFEEHAAPLLPINRDLPHDDSWTVSAITAAGGDAAFERDLEAIARFNHAHAARGAGGAVVDSIELRVATTKEVERVLDLIPGDIYPYFELPTGQDLRGFTTALAEMDAGTKLRTGGVEASAHPAPETVASFLDTCRRANVPFKATAGLHRAVRRFAESVSTRQFGFFNIFIGACLRWHDRVTAAELPAVLTDESPSSFTFDEHGLAWRDRRLDVDEVREARALFAHSFGSCSFDEPLEDLRSLGLLQGAAR